ncbi:unnamed protein product [Microthlaspi erraticum]|uniref:Uncharacterized protein n=1 Tax=Microthlaspi erraticum TaxID=1685480 RepID=A0A6D2L546_9BRAS|nr:unnamed protein product [Microthlaspi erraticum]
MAISGSISDSTLKIQAGDEWQEFLLFANSLHPGLSHPLSFKLVEVSSIVKHLFQVHARLIASGNFWDSSSAIRLLKCSSRFGDASYTLSIFRSIGKFYFANPVFKAYLDSSTPRQALEESSDCAPPRKIQRGDDDSTRGLCS